MSRKNVSAIVSGAGLLSAIWTELDRAVRERGGSDEDLYRLNTPNGKSIIAKLADVIVASNEKRVDLVKSAYDTYPISVNYTRTMADMIKAGKYDYANSDIKEKNFPIQRPSVSEAASFVGGGGPFRTPGVQINSIDLILVHLNKVARENEILQYMDKLSLRPRGIEYLLALGEKYPDIQREFPVVALGSRWQGSDGYWRVPCLGRNGSKRDLGLYWVDNGFSPVCCFLASSK